MSEKDSRQVGWHSKSYPPNLKKIHNPPVSLWVRGAGFDNSAIHLTGIGSRDAETAQLIRKRQFLEEVIQVYGEYFTQPLVLVSGLALGPDTVVHQTALDHDIATVGVLFTHITRMYPPENLHLAQAILAKDLVGNAIISEYGPVPDDVEVKKDPKKPLARNRITVGLSRAVIVSGVADTRSGTRNSVRLAKEEHRPVFIIQGTVSEAVRELFMGQYGAQEVSTARQMFDLLAQKE